MNKVTMSLIAAGIVSVCILLANNEKNQESYQKEQHIMVEERSLTDFAKISNEQDWITEIAVNADDKSYERADNITQFIALNDNLAHRDYQVECGDRLCGLLFSNVENESESEQIIDIFSNAEIKGSFIHYVSKLQDDGWYITRIMLPKNANEAVLNFDLSEL